MRCQGVFTLRGQAALQEKIGSDEAESDGLGGSKFEDENKVWPNFLRNPKGRGGFSRFLRRSSLAYVQYASLLAP